jgi:hypothetical protein
VPRKRRRDRSKVEYPSGSALGSVVNAEKLALGVATVAVGELTERDQVIVYELAHYFSGAIADLEQVNEQLHERLMEMVRIYG